MRAGTLCAPFLARTVPGTRVPRPTPSQRSLLPPTLAQGDPRPAPPREEADIPHLATLRGHPWLPSRNSYCQSCLKPACLWEDPASHLARFIFYSC